MHEYKPPITLPKTDFTRITPKWEYLNDEVDGYGYYRWTMKHFLRYSLRDKFVSIRHEDAPEWEQHPMTRGSHEQRRRELNYLLNLKLCQQTKN